MQISAAWVTCKPRSNGGCAAKQLCGAFSGQRRRRPRTTQLGFRIAGIAAATSYSRRLSFALPSRIIGSRNDMSLEHRERLANLCDEAVHLGVTLDGQLGWRNGAQGKTR